MIIIIIVYYNKQNILLTEHPMSHNLVVSILLADMPIRYHAVNNHNIY